MNACLERPCLNETLQILDILTNKNLLEEGLKIEYLENANVSPNIKLAILFRRYYGIYFIQDDEAWETPENLIRNIVTHKRKERFKKDKYWSIWKEEGYFFGFIEGFFHAQEGKNQLCKIRGRSISEDFLLPRFRQEILSHKFKIENQIDYFKTPAVFIERFETLEEFRLFLRVNKINRMVAKHANTNKGMHLNIYSSIKRIASDEALIEIFNEGVTNETALQIEKTLFQRNSPLTKKGLYAILSSFRGYGPKIAKMVMNLVFDIGIIAVDRRVLRSSIMLSLYELSPHYINKIVKKYNIQEDNKKEIAHKISSLSEKYSLLKTEEALNDIFQTSPFLSEADYLLFMYNGGEGWNFNFEAQELHGKGDMCRVGKCCFDKDGICLLRKKVQYKEYAEKSIVKVLRYN